jgi:ribosomal protein L37AE/L43A
MQRHKLPTKPHECTDCAKPAVALIEVGALLLWLCTQCLVERVIVQMVNQRLAELDKKVKMLMAERGPGIKPEPELVVPVDNGWDD